jgi:2,3-bisphosphoglycerate-independent phosphoglycerate mutase
MSNNKPTVLIILDGWGHSDTSDANAIAAANTPTWDNLWQHAPHTLISGSGMDVGLPDGQMGNSEVGHMTLGAGRTVYQDLTRINQAVSDGDFFKNPILLKAVDATLTHHSALHLIGLVSAGGVHSHEDHFHAMIELAVKRGATRIYVHAFLDGRDTPPRSAHESLQKIDAQLRQHHCGRVASIVGRYFAMDRDNRWDRVAQAYNLLTQGLCEFSAATAVDGLNAAYSRNENDEFVKATAIIPSNEKAVTINDGDSVIFMNFRADRARQLTRAFTNPHFSEFSRAKKPQPSSFITLTEYANDIDVPCAFSPANLTNTLGEYLANLNKKQLRIAETEKYAHVTFFFSGGQETPFNGEDRILVPSPKVATYDLKPEMSAPEVTDKIIEAIRSTKYDFIACNFANGDMVGHTGIFSAAVKAVEALDHCLARIIATLQEAGGQCLITADHGNVEQMADESTGQAHTAHTCELVPLVYVGNRNITLQQKNGKLSDVAPTLLTLMDLPIPIEMTGHNLITLTST